MCAKKVGAVVPRSCSFSAFLNKIINNNNKKNSQGCFCTVHDDVLCVYITCAPSSQESQDFLKLQKVSEAVYIFRIHQLSFIRLSALCCISVRTNNYIRTRFHLTTCSLKKKKNLCGACSLMTSCPGRFTNYNYTVLFRASS